MPPRKPEAYVWDVLDACRVIEDGLRGVGLAEYLADEMRRLAVERLLITTGEALNQLSRVDPAMAAELGSASQIVAFRNILVHGYFKLDHHQIWQILATEIGPLRGRAAGVWTRFAPLYESDAPTDKDSPPV